MLQKKVWLCILLAAAWSCADDVEMLNGDGENNELPDQITLDAVIQLPRTGQTRSYGIGDDGDLQKGG